MTHYDFIAPKDLIPQIQHLLDLHWQECAHDHPSFRADPDSELYQRLHQQDVLFAIAARIDSRIVGYVSYFIMDNAQCMGMKVAQADAIYVEERHRHGLIPGRLMLLAEQHARHCGAASFTWACRTTNDFADTLERHGYQIDYTAFRKEL